MAAILGTHNTFLRSIIINNKASFKKCVNQEYMHVLMKGSDPSGAIPTSPYFGIGSNQPLSQPGEHSASTVM